MSDARKEVVVDLSRIAWPQSCCSGCGRIGSGVEEFGSCRCLEPFITIYSARSYRALMAKAHAPRPLKREEVAPEDWARRRAG